MIRVSPLIPAVCLERIAVGTYFRDIERICSPNPGNIFSQTDMVASGVTSLISGPVPPVVKIIEQFFISAKSIKASSITDFSSGTNSLTICHGDDSVFFRNYSIAGPLRSSYSPALALSDAVKIPNRHSSPVPIVLP